jgi:alkanesulfonate monooxygenase
VEILWYLPNAGIDGHYLGTRYGGRVADIDYLKQIAMALDKLGFVGALIPTGRECEDSWVIGAALTTVTHKMKFLIAVRPSLFCFEKRLI